MVVVSPGARARREGVVHVRAGHAAGPPDHEGSSPSLGAPEWTADRPKRRTPPSRVLTARAWPESPATMTTNPGAHDPADDAEAGTPVLVIRDRDRTW